MIYLIGGENLFQSREALSNMISLYEKKGVPCIGVYIDDEDSEKQIMENCLNTSFFSEKRLIVVKALEQASTEQRKKIEDILDKVEDMILWSRTKLDKRSTLYKLVKEKGKVQEYGLPNNKVIDEWINSYSSKIGLKLTSSLIKELSFRTGPSPLILASEMLKLKYLQDEGIEISVDIMKNITILNEEASIWEFMDSLTDRNKIRSLNLLEKLTRELEYEYIMGFIVRQLRLYYLALNYKDKSKLIKFGIHPFVATKILRQTQLLNKSKLEKLYQRVVDMEIGVKSGRLDKMLALDLLVIAF